MFSPLEEKKKKKKKTLKCASLCTTAALPLPLFGRCMDEIQKKNHKVKKKNLNPPYIRWTLTNVAAFFFER